MSWASWIPALTVHDPVNYGAILGIDGSVWAKTDNFTPSEAEMQALVAGLSKGNAGAFPSFTFQGIKFITLRFDGDEIDAKSQENCISVVKTSKCILVGAYFNSGRGAVEAGSQKVSVAVGKVRSALVSAGY